MAKKEHGFTLLEILIVVVILGITLRFAVLSFGDFGEKRKIVATAEHIAETIRLVRQQAILESTPMAITINQQSLNVFRYSNNNWVEVKSNLFHNQHISTRIKMNLKQKRIMISDLGEFTPFTILLGTSQNSAMVSIQSYTNGIVKVNKSP